MKLYLYREGQEWGASREKQKSWDTYKVIELSEDAIAKILEDGPIKKAFNTINK